MEHMELVEAVAKYCNLANERLYGRVLGPPPGFGMARHDITSLRSIVDDLERTPEFDAVITSANNIEKSSLSNEITRDGTENFFRRSGFYLDSYQGRQRNFTELAATYRSLLREEVAFETRYLAPIAFVEFPSQVDLESFSIRHFSPRELSDITQDQIAKVFYPSAALSVSDLMHYWFVDLSVKDPPVTLEPLPDDFDFFAYDFSVSKAFTKFPKPLEQALLLLALWDW